MVLRRFLSLVLLVACVQPQLIKSAEQEVKKIPISVYSYIAQELLTAADAQNVNPDDVANSADMGNDELFTEGQKRSIVFNLFGAYSWSRFSPSPIRVINTKPIWEDIEFFSQSNLFSKIKRTTTIFGEAVCARMLAEPTPDQKELMRRQAIVKTLVDDEKLFNHIKQVLTEIKTIEPLLLSFFSEKNLYRQRMLSSLYFDREMWANAGYTEEWDKSPNALLASECFEKSRMGVSLLFSVASAQNTIEHFGLIRMLGVWSAVLLFRFKPDLLKRAASYGSIGFGLLALHRLWNKNKNKTTTPPDDQKKKENDNGPTGLGEQFKKQWDRFRFVSALYQSMEVAVGTPFTFLMQFRSIKSWYTNLIQLQKKFMRFSDTLNKLGDISDSLLERTDLVMMTTEVHPLLKLFKAPQSYSPDMQKLLRLLRTKTFKGKPSIFSHIGRISAVNKLMDTGYVAVDWVKVFESIGYLDSYLSAATLIKEFKDKQVPFCFVSYAAADKPFIQLTDFWNPLVDPEKAVVNSVELGNSKARNIIITGPNTSGKSTIMNSVIISIVLAQAFGIAPARSMQLTPFSSINTFVNIKSDVRKGHSLFAAEVARSHELVAQVGKLKPHEFGFTLIDEMYRGTDREQQEELAYSYAKDRLGKFPNSMCIQATHCYKLVELERDTNGLFKNYKVEIDRAPDGKLLRNYKLKEGWTNQKVAADVLKEMGLL